MKKQGYLDKLYESLGARNKTKGKQTLHDRSNESIGEEKKLGHKAYSAVKTMDKGDRKASLSKEHMKEYAHYSPAMLKKHMKEEKVLLKSKEKKSGMDAHPWAHHPVSKLKKHMDGIHKLIAHKMGKKSGKYGS